MSKLLQNLILREKIIDAIRDYFKKENFREVETPLLVPAVIPESYLEHFTITLFDRRRKKRKMFLTSSPEASLKKLITYGLGNCFEITRSFRNGETDSLLHTPEFTILEWYRIGVDYRKIMDDCEKLFNHILSKVKRQKSKGKSTIDLSSPWERISVAQAFKKYAKIDFDEITTKKEITKVAKRREYQVSARNTWEEIFNQIFLNEVEPHLGTHGKPTIIFDYPVPLAALAKLKKDDPRFAERFELYTGGLELGDCYTELTDWRQQQKRFENEMEIIKKSGKTKVTDDKQFIKALKKGLPECSGMAMGIDRIVMLFGNISDIKETKFCV